MSVVTTVVWFLIAISILVAIHEYGHFYAARRCGVKVLRFSIGFGPRILSYTDKSGTEFALSAIPLGGYVKMLDEREGNVDEANKAHCYNQKSVGKRIFIAAAGPLANVILAFALYWAILLQGTVIYSPTIGAIEPGSLAEQAGLAIGQDIISVDGVPTPGRRDVVLALIERLGETGTIEIEARHSGDDLTYSSPVRIQDWMRDAEEPDPLSGLGIQFYFPPLGKVIGQVSEGGPAEQAGFLPGDEIVSAEGINLEGWEDWVDLVRANPGREISVWVLRNDSEVELLLVPDAKKDDSGQSYGFAGVGVVLPNMPEDMRRIRHFGFLGAAVEASVETKEAIAFVFLSLKKLIFAEISIKNLSGPIGIAKVAADQAQHGFWAFLSFLAHVSIVLAVLNILPIPVLDGGHILFCVVEWVKGSALSERAQLLGVKAGMALLMCVMVIAFYNDILRL